MNLIKKQQFYNFHKITNNSSHCINLSSRKTVVLIVHNLFAKPLRTLSLNCHRFFLTQSLRDKGQLQALARQAFPGKSQFVIQAFDDSMKARYGHICLDFSPDCNPVCRVTSNWFAQSTAINCYVYKFLIRMFLKRGVCVCTFCRCNKSGT